MRWRQETPVHSFQPAPRVYLTLVTFFALSLPGVILAGHDLWHSGSLRVTFTLASSVVMLSVGIFFVILSPLEVQITEDRVVIRRLTHRTTVPVELIELVEVRAIKPRSKYLPRTHRVVLHVRGRSRPLVLIESHFNCAPGELTRRLQELVGPEKYVE